MFDELAAGSAACFDICQGSSESVGQGEDPQHITQDTFDHDRRQKSAISGKFLYWIF